MYDVAIVGGGPGGYAAALYAHNFDLKVALIERDLVGGTCLHRGCIPAKAWLRTAEVFSTVAGASPFGVDVGAPVLDWARALDRKDAIVSRLHSGLSGLLVKRQVDVIAGTGRLAGPGAVEVAGNDGRAHRIEAANVIVATGSAPRTIPGYQIDGERIVTSDEALDWTAQPGRVAVIGGGAIGAEFASMLIDLGSRVSMFEIEDQVLPGMEPAAARVLQRALERRGVEIRTGIGVDPPRVSRTGLVIPYADEAFEVDVVLVAVGRAPVTGGVGLETTAAELDHGFVKVDLASMQTAQPGLYAVGDIVAGTPQLAHSGFAEAMAAMTHIATGEPAPVDFRAIPLVVYTHPEVAAVGLTEAQAVAQGYAVDTHDHGLAGVARAMIQGETSGSVKVVVERGGPILGATVVGPHAGELIHELMYAVGWEALPSEAAAFIHAHPTIAEAIGETLLTSAGRSLH